MIKIKSGRGITLIALIVTIIVLLILAAVTIITITGQNGMLNRAQSAREKTDKATEEENERISGYEQGIDEIKNYGKKHKVIINKGSNIKSVTGEGEYKQGEMVTITAELNDSYTDTEYTYEPQSAAESPAENDEKYLLEHSYEFKGWTGALNSNDMEFTFEMGNRNMEFEVNAEEKTTKASVYKYTKKTAPGTVSFQYSTDGINYKSSTLSKGFVGNRSPIWVKYSDEGVFSCGYYSSSTDPIVYFKFEGQLYTITKSKGLTIDIGSETLRWVKQ